MATAPGEVRPCVHTCTYDRMTRIVMTTHPHPHTHTYASEQTGQGGDKERGVDAVFIVTTVWYCVVLCGTDVRWRVAVVAVIRSYLRSSGLFDALRRRRCYCLKPY